jgi:hypothetical protein
LLFANLFILGRQCCTTTFTATAAHLMDDDLTASIPWRDKIQRSRSTLISPLRESKERLSPPRRRPPFLLLQTLDRPGTTHSPLLISSHLSRRKSLQLAASRSRAHRLLSRFLCLQVDRRSSIGGNHEVPPSPPLARLFTGLSSISGQVVVCLLARTRIRRRPSAPPVSQDGL